jgi:hypothetical protein
MTDADHELTEHLADVKRDAGDHLGAAVIAANAGCAGCVAVQAVNLGLVIAAENPGLDANGYIELPEDERAALDGFLVQLQEEFR